MYLEEIRYANVDWIHLAYKGERCQPSENSSECYGRIIDRELRTLLII